MALRAASLVVFAACLLLAAAQEGLRSDFDDDDLAVMYPELYEETDISRDIPTEPRRHLRHRKSLVHAAPAKMDKLAQEDAESPTTNKSATPMALPGRFPAVEKALGGMDGDLRDLREKQLVAKQTRGELEGTVTDAVQHMNDAMGIKQAMAHEKARLRIETGKLQKLETDFGRLGQTHDSLVTSLRRVIIPKLMFAKTRFEKKEAFLRKEEDTAKVWMTKVEQLKASAMESIKKKKASHESLLQAEAAVAEAKKKEKLARIQYEHDLARTSEEVQSYRYAETRYKAELHHEEAAKAAATRAHESLEKLHDVLKIEQEKVERSIGYREYKLRRKMHDVEAARQKSTNELTELERKYRDWQESQRKRTVEVVKKGRETAAASQDYAARQKQVLDAAQAKVAREAESGGDWDDWGSGNEFTKMSDESDDDSDDN